MFDPAAVQVNPKLSDLGKFKQITHALKNDQNLKQHLALESMSKLCGYKDYHQAKIELEKPDGQRPEWWK